MQTDNDNGTFSFSFIGIADTLSNCKCYYRKRMKLLFINEIPRLEKVSSVLLILSFECRLRERATALQSRLNKGTNKRKYSFLSLYFVSMKIMMSVRFSIIIIPFLCVCVRAVLQ